MIDLVNQPYCFSKPAGAAARPPGLRLPDLQIFEPYDIHTVGSAAGGDLRLKFGTTIWNAGAGPLETRGAENPATKQLEVYQYLYPRGRARRGRGGGSVPSTTTTATATCTCRPSPAISSGRSGRAAACGGR